MKQKKNGGRGREWRKYEIESTITLLLIINASLLGRSELEKEDKDENKSHTHTSTRLLHYTLIHWLLHPDVHKRTHIHIIYDTHTYIYRLK